ncbi:GFA family protein [Acuticoccus kandeliae]|uniref:GFA family protein n=1 Tax=Acuticoccus kandeliae TaxID=2073160 RepID=UPI000D3E6157|nr:GFA family protein [Acuticoccus kandeliae]
MKHLASGRCLCGAARFEIAGEWESFFLCHCARCRKDTGTAHAANLFSSRAEITWLSGRETIKTFQLPGTRHVRSFCTECGSALPSLQLDGALLVVPAGSLDTEVGIRPTAHISYASRASWDDRLDAVEKIDELPS